MHATPVRNAAPTNWSLATELTAILYSAATCKTVRVTKLFWIFSVMCTWSQQPKENGGRRGTTNRGSCRLLAPFSSVINAICILKGRRRRGSGRSSGYIERELWAAAQVYQTKGNHGRLYRESWECWGTSGRLYRRALWFCSLRRSLCECATFLLHHLLKITIFCSCMHAGGKEFVQKTKVGIKIELGRHFRTCQEAVCTIWLLLLVNCYLWLLWQTRNNSVNRNKCHMQLQHKTWSPTEGKNNNDVAGEEMLTVR